MSSYRFLLDRDVQKAKNCFPRKRAITAAEAGLADDAPDSVVVERAFDLGAIIVTANGDDFFREVIKFQRKTKRTADGCREMNGLVVLSSGFEVQRRQIARALERMYFGSDKIDWADVWNENYYVRLKDGGRAEVNLLPRCRYCDRLTRRT
jgi:hypothetical protein